MIQDTIFLQYQPELDNFYQESFLNLDFAFNLNDQLFQSNIFDLENDLAFQPFKEHNSNHSGNYFIELQKSNNNQENDYPNDETSSNQIKKQKVNHIAKSKKTKNMCFNICQKTIKVIKTKAYDQKFSKICSKYNQEEDKIIASILKIKKNLTGPKALDMFIKMNGSTSKIFREFMRWFLQEKYLRHAIKQGTMDDLKGYLQFKNQVLLNILEN